MEAYRVHKVIPFIAEIKIGEGLSAKEADELVKFEQSRIMISSDRSRQPYFTIEKEGK